jgi:hypothetical protein
MRFTGFCLVCTGTLFQALVAAAAAASTDMHICLSLSLIVHVFCMCGMQ